jgi:hypothetical protein
MDGWKDVEIGEHIFIPDLVLALHLAPIYSSRILVAPDPNFELCKPPAQLKTTCPPQTTGPPVHLKSFEVFAIQALQVSSTMELEW